MQSVNQQNGDERMLQRYLLGDLSAQEQESIEELYFAEDDYLQKLLVAENDLIDDYLRGKLSTAEQQKFERNYLTTPEKKQRVHLVRQLRRQANEPVSVPTAVVVESPREQKTAWWQTLLAALYPRNPVTRYAMVFGVLAVMIVGVVFVKRTARLRSELAQAEQEKEVLRQNETQFKQQLLDQQRRNDELARALDQARDQQKLLDEVLSRPGKTNTAVVPSFELGGNNEPPSSAFGPHSGKTKPKTLVILKDARLVRLAFKINTTGYQNYRLALLTPGGAELWSRSEQLARLARPGQAITLHLPAKLLNNGDYIFKLSLSKQDNELGAVKEYPVTVERR
jgi:hypothetical protein